MKRLTEAQLAEMLSKWFNRVTQESLAKHYGISKIQVANYIARAKRGSLPTP